MYRLLLFTRHVQPANTLPIPAHSSTPTLPDALSLIQHWLAACAANPWNPLSYAAAQPYRVIWNTWLRYLSGYELHWSQAQAVHVLGFIRTSPQSARQHSASDITRRRYWRVLNRIYDHALLHGWVADNPAQGIAAHERPPSEDSKGAILWPQMWRALQAQIPAPQDLISTRDHAVLLLLMELGLTPEEVRHLSVADVQLQRPNQEAAPSLDTESSLPPPPRLRIQGERDRQSRTLPLSAGLAQALSRWLAARQAYHAMQEQTTLFCSRKSPRLSSHTLLHIISKTLRQAAYHSGLPEPARLGPQIIRNTVLVQWLENGIPVEEVLARAGLKQAISLKPLRDYWGT